MPRDDPLEPAGKIVLWLFANTLNQSRQILERVRAPYYFAKKYSQWRKQEWPSYYSSH